MLIPFYKYQGTGNDFILIDNREGLYNQLSEKQVNKICDRHFGIGGDGLMLLNLKPNFDFEMIYYNADGKIGSMCGNGGRCIVRFANDLGIKKDKYLFIATDGPHEAIIEEDIVKLKMKNVDEIQHEDGHYILNTGSPHYISIRDEIESLDVVNEGRKIRYNPTFHEQGINVNFIQKKSENRIAIRTYERGVENETLSCGTGLTAAALVSASASLGLQKIFVETRGGDLFVEFEKENDQKFSNIWLCGPATFVFSGKIEI